MQVVTATNQIALRSLANYTSAVLLQPRLEGRTVRAVMEELVGVLRPEACPPTVRHAASKALNRELLTGCVDSRAAKVAMHLPGETQPRFVLGCAPEPLPWRAVKLTPIEFVILLVEPPPGGEEGKQVSAALTRLTHDNERLDALRAAQSAADMLAVLAQVSVPANGRDTVLQPSVLQRGAKPVIHLDTLEPGSHGKRHWRGTQSVVGRP